MRTEFLALAVVVAIFVAGGTALMQSGLLSYEGVFDYHCSIHSEEGMEGQLVVKS